MEQVIGILKKMIGRQHPVFGFIYLDALDYNKVYSRLLTMRDNDLKNGINESGFPTGFESWCKDHLKELCAQSKYQKRVKDHIEQLNLTIENRERELSRTYLVEQLNELKDKKSFLETLIQTI